MKRLYGVIALSGLLVLSACTEEKADALTNFEKQRKTNIEERYKDTMEQTTGLSVSFKEYIQTHGQEKPKHKLLSEEKEDYENVLENLDKVIIVFDQMAEQANETYTLEEGSAEEDYVPPETNEEEVTFEDVYTEPDVYSFKDNTTGSVTVALYYTLPNKSVRVESEWLGDVHIATIVYID